MHLKSIPTAKLISPFFALAIVSAACGGGGGTNPPINGDAGGGGGRDTGGGGGTDSGGGGGNHDGGGGGGMDGGGGGTDGGGGGNFNAQMVATQIATAQCGFYMRCEPARFSFNGWAMQDCVNQIQTQLTNNFGILGPAINANRIVYHPEKLTACISEYSMVDCQLGQLDDSSCNNILQGAQAANAGCMFAAECQTGNWCNNQATGPGTCGKCSPVAALGADCAATGFNCATFSTCTATAATQRAFKCVPDNAGENAACAITYMGLATAGLCRGHLECVGMADNGTCKRPGAAAAAACDATLAMNPGCDIFQNWGCGAANTCTAITWNGAGPACGTEPNQCNHTAYCPTPTMMGQAVNCTAQPTAGASCADPASTCTMGNYCDNLLMTSTNTCMADKANGAMCLPGQCTSPSDCIGFHVTGMQIAQGTCGPYQYQTCQ